MLKELHFTRSDGQPYEVVETADEEFMVLVNGHQWSQTGIYDRSGAGDSVFPTVQDARCAYDSGFNTFGETKTFRVNETNFFVSYHPRRGAHSYSVTLNDHTKWYGAPYPAHVAVLCSALDDFGREGLIDSKTTNWPEEDIVEVN